MEVGSGTVAPPFGDATTIWYLADSRKYGSANSGCKEAVEYPS